jgi:pyridoxamine 5'-phosphate oxidase
MSDPRARPLRRADLDADPRRQFEAWREQAEAAEEPFPEAVALATATPEGEPSVRIVLLKGVDERGFSFFSGYESRKGRELSENPRAALCFYWHGLGRQVRIEGTVERLPPDESDEYFATRPHNAQLSAAASRQSEVVPGRAELEAAVGELRSRHSDGAVPRPSDWGGFIVRPERYEFWQHREDRLHDRFRYRREGESWVIERLAP